jgi:uncharacterized phage-associated protein
MPFSAKAVANYLLDRAKSDGRSLDPMQLQKLVYYAHGWHLALVNKPLIKEAVEAWPYGPVIPVLFHEFKRWGSGAVQKPATDFVFPQIHHPIRLEDEGQAGESLDTARRVIDRVWDVYGRFSGVKLSEMTHEAGSPWAAARRANPGARGVPIPNEAIRHYFKQRIARDAAAAANA